MYSDCKRVNEGVKVVSRSRLFSEILSECAPKIQSKRPVMIFFETLQDAYAFQTSEEFEPYVNKCIILNERQPEKDRNLLIMRAMQKESITLVTRPFGRGTDFIIYERSVSEGKGAHLVCTFVPRDKSEEVQIIGRVARQDNPGSYCFIFTEDELDAKLKLKLNEN